jgi:hypothetical protein
MDESESRQSRWFFGIVVATPHLDEGVMAQCLDRTADTRRLRVISGILARHLFAVLAAAHHIQRLRPDVIPNEMQGEKTEESVTKGLFPRRSSGSYTGCIMVRYTGGVRGQHS